MKEFKKKIEKNGKKDKETVKETFVEDVGIKTTKFLLPPSMLLSLFILPFAMIFFFKIWYLHRRALRFLRRLVCLFKKKKNSKLFFVVLKAFL